MLELYHNAFSSCSQKVRIVLGGKGLDWKGHEIDLMGGGQHDPAYVKLNPNHVVPTLVHDGRVLIESTLINEYLEDAFPSPSLRPEEPGARHGMRLFVKHVDEHVHPAAGILTYGVATRPMVIARPPEERAAAWANIPDPTRRAARQSVIEHGVAAPEMKGAIAAFVGMLDRMEGLLDGRAWLAGDGFSLADASALPYVLRLDHLALGDLIAARARTADWFARVQALDSYPAMVGDVLPAPIVALFRTNAEAVKNELDALVASI